MKKYLILVAGAGAAYIAYRYMKAPQTGSYSVMKQSNGNMNTSMQPSQTYPFQPNISPRVDNSNQPWYGGTRSGLLNNGSPEVGSIGDIASQAGSISKIVSSASSIWDDLGVSDWFQNDEPAEVGY